MKDISENYISMCGHASEIQSQWDFTSEFNLLYNKVDKKPYLNVTLYVQNRIKNKDSYIWLPSQSQLQGMIEEKDNLRQCYMIVEWLNDCHDNHHNYHHRFESMEQLWLAFVMKEKYNKIWNEEDWEVLR